MRYLPYRVFFFINIMIICFSSLLIAGGGIYLLRSSVISQETMSQANTTIEKLALETEVKLSAIENSLLILNRTVGVIELDLFAQIMDETIWDQELIRAIYVIDSKGITQAVGTRESRNALHSDYVGIDFSQTPLFKSIQNQRGQLVWSDIFVSVLSGDTSVGVGVAMSDYTLIAELSLQSVLGTLISINDQAGRLWVIDGRGELIADTENSEEAGIQNVRTVQFMTKAVRGESVDDVVTFDGYPYHVAYARSDKLGWLFLWGTPSGLYNEKIQNTLYSILLIAFTFFALAFVISPIWIRRISTDVESLKQQAEVIAEDHDIAEVINTHVAEFKGLSRHMYKMHGEIKARENELKELNKSLEFKVEERTQELKAKNAEQLASMRELQSMQETLVESEKHASLGRMVAGVAHELNTPIGNAVTALSSFRQEVTNINDCLKNGIKKSELDNFIAFVERGADISYRNVQRAAELVTSFKHVASDQTSSIRREFNLKDLVQDVLITLQPMIKRTEHRIEIDIEDDLYLDSYPGTLVQILTNLIENAFNHAWMDNNEGLLTIGVNGASAIWKTEHTSQWLEIIVKDNGIGIPQDVGKKVFDPFFTSKAGLGGTGLGLNISINGARKILGGDLDYYSEPDEGTVFYLTIPMVAPIMESNYSI